jgi:hypothetical protein
MVKQAVRKHSMHLKKALAFAAIGGAFGIAAQPASASQIQTYVLDVSGQSSYGTYSVPSPVLDFFGPTGLAIPSNGLPTGGLPGVARLTTGASGVLVDSAAASGSGDSTFGSWSANGSSSANATYGKVGAEGSGTRLHIGDGNTVVGFEGFGIFTDSLTFNSASLNGTVGSTIFHFTIDGTVLSVGAVNTVGMVANYQQNSAPIYTLMAANLQPASPPYFVPSTGTGHDGFTIGASSISGIGVFDTNPLSLTYGTAFDFSFGLLAYAMPRDGSASSTFSSTALLTGIDVFDALGNPVNDFSILSESGTVYDASGVHLAPSVPEPNTLALLATGMICLFGRELVRRRKAGSLQPIA